MVPQVRFVMRSDPGRAVHAASSDLGAGGRVRDPRLEGLVGYRRWECAAEDQQRCPLANA